MKTKIKDILTKIESLQAELRKEHERLADKYGFSIKLKRISFIEKIKKQNKKLRIPVLKYIVPTNIRHFVSIPFIYAMIIPVVVLDIFLSVYNFIALPLYRIPKVKRKEYIIYDRQFLGYLNVIQKVNCLYCSYVNGLFAYAVEIGARTERYWCPLKAAKAPKVTHGWYKDFADYGNPEEWRGKFNEWDDSEKI
ncbi:MAG: hypothetical protein PHF35_03235 [Candidatus Moranbacteria bacterium]|nr:hypothetical protein [Candidatus Moranbacteria bacterium]